MRATTDRTRTRAPRPVRRRIVAVAAITTLAVAACGTDDGGGADSGDDGATTTVAEENAAAVSSSPPDVEVTLVDFAFDGLPASVPSGTSFRISNEATSELHELVAFRVPDDEERSVEQLLELPPDELMAAFGGPPRLVMLAEPGSSDAIVAVGDGTLDEPGRYAVLCVIPTGADPTEYLAAAATSDGPPEVDGGPPHVVHGMWAELVVE